MPSVIPNGGGSDVRAPELVAYQGALGEQTPLGDAVIADVEQRVAAIAQGWQEGDSDHAQLQFAYQRNRDRLEITQPIDRGRRDDSLHHKTDARRKRMEVVAPTQPGDDQSAAEINQHMTQFGFSDRPYACP